ncbi:MAG: alpha/beta fold hydrolase [Acholeplasmataceae bacterium]
MKTFKYNDLDIKYLVEGEGKPLLVLNGIMMTINSWEPIAEPFRKQNTLIRLDMIDQGQSSKVNYDYTISDQADMIASFIKHLGYSKISVMGISYGGYVGINLASRYPDLVDRLVLFNTAADVDKRDAELFKTFLVSAKGDDPYAFYLATIPQFYGPTWYTTRNDWMLTRESILIEFFKSKPYRETVYRLAKSCLSHDCKDKLKDITAHTLIVSGEEDYLLPYPRQEYLHQHIKNSQLVQMAKTGHVSPYENPWVYTSLTFGFINNPALDFKI